MWKSTSVLLLAGCSAASGGPSGNTSDPPLSSNGGAQSVLGGGGSFGGSGSSPVGSGGISAGGTGSESSGGGTVIAPEGGSGLPDVVFAMNGHVDAGGEVQSCAYVPMPTDRGEIAVNNAESHFTPGSHHFLVYRTSYTSVPNGDSSPHDCSGSEQVANIKGSYYEAQTPDTRRVLPAGVAHVFQPGEILLLTAHYLNTSAVGLDTHVDFRLHTMDRAKVVHEAGSIFFYNFQITIPPLADVTVTRECPVTGDMNFALLWSHMHSRGVKFVSTTSDEAASDQLGDLYDSTDWSEPAARVFPSAPPVTIHAGSKIRYSCEFHNTTSQTIVQGVSAATNEMCILHGMYWPRLDSATETCLNGVSSQTTN